MKHIGWVGWIEKPDRNYLYSHVSGYYPTFADDHLERLIESGNNI